MALPRSESTLKHELLVRITPPVHKLAPDLIGDIFTHVLQSSEMGTFFYYKSLGELRDVCHWWRDIIDDTSSFWRRLDCTMSEDLFNLSLQNSKEGPLDITCYCYNRRTRQFRGSNRPCLTVLEMDSDIPRAISNDVEKHCRRWESLTFHEGAAAVIQGYLKLPLPSLRRLTIECSQGREVYFEKVDGLIFGGERPTLLELSLKGYRLPWDRLGLEELRSFKAEVRRNTPTVMGVKVLQLLSRAPLLESLSYTGYGSDDEPNAILAMRFTPPLVRPAIKVLHLTCCSNSFVEILFRSIIPHPSGVQCINLDLRDVSRTRSLAFLRAIGRFLNALSPPADKIKLHLQLNWQYSGCLCFDFGPVRVSFERAQNAIIMLNAIFGECITEVALERRFAVKNVQIGFCRSLEDLPLKIMDQVNGSFPEVSHFKFNGMGVEALPKAFEALSVPEPLLPRLMELDIATLYYQPMEDGVIDALQQCLSVRKSIMKWSLGRLRCSDAQFERLQGIVPPGNLNVNDLSNKARKSIEEEEPLKQPQDQTLNWSNKPNSEPGRQRARADW